MQKDSLRAFKEGGVWACHPTDARVEFNVFLPNESLDEAHFKLTEILEIPLASDPAPIGEDVVYARSPSRA